MQAGFSSIDITPCLGTLKIGWIKKITIEKILDPLFAHVAVFRSGEGAAAFIQLDTLSVRWTTTTTIRQRIEAACGFPGAAIMVAATHNHSGPAVANAGDVERDDGYVNEMVDKVVQCFVTAHDNLAEAQLDFGHGANFEVAKNRRVVMRDGTVKTHSNFGNPEALCLEGPVDPEVGVLVARGSEGKILGCLVNYACHPTHSGDDPVATAGYPGVLARALAANGIPHTVFLNGACGNLHHSDPTTGKSTGQEEAGASLARSVLIVLESVETIPDCVLSADVTTVELPYRTVTDAEIQGTVRGAQRFGDPALYDTGMDKLLTRIRERKSQPAEIQVLHVSPLSIVGIPAEYFTEFGLRIKESVYPRHALVVGHANGMVGYLPTRAAFARGGYETTFGWGYRQAPEAGDLLTDAAIALIRKEAP